jgi:transcriptional regulator with XRE-family HTH domain
MYKEDILKKIGLRIREIRIRKNISIQQLADMIDIEYNNLIRIEKGRTNITVGTLLKICQSLEVRLIDVVDVE